MMFRLTQLKKKGVTLTENVKYIPQWRINNALNTAYENAGYREKAVLDDLKTIELNSHVYPGDRYVTADLYNTEGDGCQIIVLHETNQKRGYKPGDITG